ncbi:uncharacterized protein [Pocillopora verrucosa]|uniref:uncharacterized protein n=1 Tax=Pocillopora verrucosa TaxID=203993 RepID=UPI00333F46DC
MLVKPALVILLLVATANWTSASPVRSARSPSEKVVDYKVQISETGTEYNETIEVATEKQTELFKVPAHNDVDESNILHDFKTNMTMMLLPEKKICYLMPLSEEMPTPAKLESDLDRTEELDKDKTKIIDSKWIVDKEMANRSELSKELANFCTQYPIYQVKIMDGSLTSTRVETEGTHHRSRRNARSFPPIHPCNLCAGGKGTVTYWDKCWCSNIGGYWKIETKIASRTCITIQECFGWCCWSKHLVYYVYCSQYVCQRPTYYRPRPHYQPRLHDERNEPIAL